MCSRKVRFLKIPGEFRWLMPRKSLAFCLPLKYVKEIVILLIVAITFHVAAYFLGFPILAIIIVALVEILLCVILGLGFSSTIVIRKDCSECRFGFHIIAHEQSHLRLNSGDEIVVELETLKESGERLVPLLLEDNQFCDNCVFRWREMYVKATHKYLQHIP